MGINKGASRCKGNKTPSGVLIKPTSNGFQSPKDDPGTARVFADLRASPSASFSRVVKAVPGLEDNQRVLESRTRYASGSRASSLLPPPCRPVFVSGHRPASRSSLFDFYYPPSFCLCNILVLLDSPSFRSPTGANTQDPSQRAKPRTHGDRHSVSVTPDGGHCGGCHSCRPCRRGVGRWLHLHCIVPIWAVAPRRRSTKRHG